MKESDANWQLMLRKSEAIRRTTEQEAQNQTPLLLMDRVLPVSLELAQEFMCSVCLDLVQDPVDCVTCQNLVCEKCLASIMNVCPNKCPKSFVPVTIDSRPDLMELMKLV
jgi:hypothetical protein